MLFKAIVKKKTSTGRSMLEMIAVLGIMGILSLGALSGVNYVKDKNLANQILKEALTQASEIQTNHRIKRRTNDSLEIIYPYKDSSEYIKSWSFQNDSKKEVILRAFNVSSGVCQKLTAAAPSNKAFKCIGSAKHESAVESCEDLGICEDGNDLVFITEARIRGSGGEQVNPCANVRCTGNRVCIAGVCQCQEGYHEEDGECERCGDPKAVCNKTDEQLSVVDTNGCPIYERKNCPENACNLLTGDCCSESEKYDATAGMCCAPAKKLTDCDNLVSSSSGECSYYQGCIDSTCYTEYDNDGECCSDMNTSETCCYAVHIKAKPEYYTTSNVKNLLSYNPNDTTQKCQCKNGYDNTRNVCCNTGEYASEGHCCPVGQEWVNGANECMPKCIGPGLKENQRNSDYGCVCEDGASGTGCTCPAGQTLVDGQCRRLFCIGGPDYYICSISFRNTNYQCGYQCDAYGANCSLGKCLGEGCSDEEPFSFIGQANYYWGCKKYHPTIPNIICGKLHSWDDYKCYDKHETEDYAASGGQCMTADASLNPAAGTCDRSVCDKYKGEWFRWGSDDNTRIGGCKFEGNLQCLPYGSTWKCYKNGLFCGEGCSSPLSCGTCSENKCWGDLIFDASTNRCYSTTSPYPYYCELKEGNYYQHCYRIDSNGKETTERCGYVASNYINVDHPWSGGDCDGVNCPAGMVYGFLPGSLGNVWGCIPADGNVKSGMACRYQGDFTPNVCYFKEKLCGYYCDYAGKGCKAIHDIACSDGECPHVEGGYDMTKNNCSCETGQITTIGDTDYCCAPGHIYLGGVCSKSVCPPEDYVTSGGICLSKEECLGYSMFLSGKMCIEKCPKTQVASEGVCVDACPDAQVVSEGVCVNACPAGQFVFDRVCIKSCSASQVLSKGSCVTKCPTGQVITNICNPNNSTACQNVCVDTCPEGQAANAQNICQ